MNILLWFGVGWAAFMIVFVALVWMLHPEVRQPREKPREGSGPKGAVMLDAREAR